MENRQTPRDYGVDHSEWRPHQLESITWALNSNEQYLIMEAPTGSGKSATAAAISSSRKTIALCRTKSLQEFNYGNTYGFDILFGKPNYPCVHPKYIGSTVDACAYKDDGMYTCPFASNCEYIVDKGKLFASRKGSLNYALYLGAPWARNLGTEMLVMDEAHQLPDIVLDKAGIEISEDIRKKYGMPPFPETIMRGSSSLFFVDETQRPENIIVGWLSDAARATGSSMRSVEGKTDEKSRRFARACENWINKITATIDAIDINANDWYIASGSNVGYNSKGQKVPALIARPLSAKYHFKTYFDVAQALMMSATIGNAQDFASELGIQQFDYHRVENMWPPKTRPILDLGAPRMGHKSTDKEYDKQADLIARVIRSCPPTWSGVIHVTRKSEAVNLSQRLSKRGLGSRVWVPDFNDPTNVQMKKWESVKKNSSLGRLVVTWAFWEGVDLTEERICIAAKTPFPNLGNEYEFLRMKYSAKTYQWRAATQLEQSLGRTRRGEPDDYDLNGRREQLVAIADSNYRRIQNSLSQDFKDAIVRI